MNSSTTLARPPTRVAIFGKHPTAADHIEDVGISTTELAAFKQQFYVTALGTCLARSVWSEEVPAGTQPPYNHALLTVNAQGWIAARFAASEDATGRTQYPLVVCLQSPDHEGLQAGAGIWQSLERQLDAARAAETPDRLRRVATDSSEIPPPLGSLSGRPAWVEAQGIGLFRVAHALSPLGSGVNRVRVPLTGADPATSAIFWTSFITHLQPVKAITLVWPAGAAFADLMLAAPEPVLFHSLFAPESKVPLTSAVPFSISDEVRTRTSAVLDTWQNNSRLFPAAAASAPEEKNLPFFGKLARDVRGWFGT